MRNALWLGKEIDAQFPKPRMINFENKIMMVNSLLTWQKLMSNLCDITAATLWPSGYKLLEF